MLTVTWTRQLAVGSSRTISQPYPIALTETQRALLINVTESSEGNISIPLPQLVPKFVHLPAVANAAPIALEGLSDQWHTYQNLTLVRSASSVSSGAREQWWSLHQSRADVSFNTSRDDGLQIVTAADSLVSVPGFALGGGILAFYTVIVYAIARTVRASAQSSVASRATPSSSRGPPRTGRSSCAVSPPTTHPHMSYTHAGAHHLRWHALPPRR